MREFTEWVIAHTIAQLSAWHEHGLSLPISIVLTVNHTSPPDFAENFEKKLWDVCFELGLLGVEYLETPRILESTAALNGLKMLKSRVFKISLYAFGAGYININYRRKIQLDINKLDRSIVSNINDDKSNYIIVGSIIRLLKQIDYVVLAEDVEDVKTLEILRYLGCDEVQGCFYARQMGHEDFGDGIKREERQLKINPEQFGGVCIMERM